MDLQLSPSEQAFRDEVRTFLRAELPPETARAQRLTPAVFAEYDVAQAWHRILHRRGWSAPDWPKEYGGPGWTLAERYLWHIESSRAGAPTTSPIGLSLVGPVLMHFGTPAQKQRFLPRIVSGDDYWCQGFSEPGAGSDLAALRTRAVADGDSYVVNGAKIWTSSAHWADWIFCLVRTSREERKQAGITFLCMEMNAPGVTVTPIISIDGQHHLNRVTFDDVRVPVSNRIGEEGNGWHYAQFLLGNERLSYAHVSRKRVQLRHLRALASQTPVGDGTMAEDAFFTSRLAACEVEVDVLEAVVLRALHAGAGATLATAATVKILSTELAQRITELTMELAGQNALPWIPERTSPAWADAIPGIPAFGPLAAAEYFFERASTIYGGSTEVQKNILARELMRNAPR